MSRLLIKRFGSLILSMLLFSSVAFSQFDNVDFLRSAPADGVKFVKAYIGPWANAFGAGMSGGWYNTAKPHKFGGFDITAGFNLGIVPSSDQSFEISSLGLSDAYTGSGLTSTAAGNINSQDMTLVDNASGVTLATFKTPPGTGWRYIPAPSAQLGIGLPLGTELKLRFLPKIKILDSDISLWGVGLMHSIMQHIPGSKLLPFDVSVFAGYSKLTTNIGLNLQPEAGFPNNISPSVVLDNQSFTATVDALNISAIASLNIPVLTVYGGLGYSRSKTMIELSGNYPTPVLNIDDPLNPYAEYTDAGVLTGEEFPKMEIKNFSGLRANFGLRVKLAVVTIHADYTRSQYNIFSAGLGISFR